jgi:hypothetical protein
MSEIKSGDFVRSFDFESRDLDGERACYVEGMVVDIVRWQGCDRYRIRVTDQIFRGKNIGVDDDHKEVFPPVNGTPTSMGNVCNGVVKIITN